MADDDEKQPRGQPGKGAKARSQRLSDALRRNLGRRKAQLRARRDLPEDSTGPDSGQHSKGDGD